jgi:hypothetical protein
MCSRKELQGEMGQAPEGSVEGGVYTAAEPAVIPGDRPRLGRVLLAASCCATLRNRVGWSWTGVFGDPISE